MSDPKRIRLSMPVAILRSWGARDVFSSAAMLVLPNRQHGWTWQMFEKTHAYFAAATLAALWADRASFARSVRLADVLRAAAPTSAPELGLELLERPSVGIEAAEDERQCFTSEGKSESVALDDFERVHLARDGTHRRGCLLQRAPPRRQPADGFPAVQAQPAELAVRRRGGRHERDAQEAGRSRAARSEAARRRRAVVDPEDSARVHHEP